MFILFRPRLQGPITITPSTVDNYGLDSCSLLVIPSLPPALVIAESNGKLHHALFLEAENAEDVSYTILRFSMISNNFFFGFFHSLSMKSMIVLLYILPNG